MEEIKKENDDVIKVYRTKQDCEMVTNSKPMKCPLKEEIKSEIVDDCDMMLDFEGVKNSVRKEVKEEEDYLEEYETVDDCYNF